MAIIGDLSIVASTGETITATTDIGLAWKWAELETNNDGTGISWREHSYGWQCAAVADALHALREAYSESQ